MKVSVVIPACNSGDHIKASLSSVLSQSYPVHEVWVIDNNSRSEDRTSEVVLSFNSDVVRYLVADRCANGNVARNIGSSYASGDLIAYCDSDDEWDSNHVERRVNLFASLPRAEAVYGGAYIRNNKRLVITESRPLGIEEDILEFLVGINKALAQTSSYMIRRKVWEQCPWDESISRHQDYEFFISVHEKFGWYFLEQPTYTINWHGDQVRNHQFESYWLFYQKYKYRLSSPSLAQYLFTRWREAKLFDENSKYAERFAEELKPHKRYLSIVKQAVFLCPFVLPILWPLVRSHV